MNLNCLKELLTLMDCQSFGVMKKNEVQFLIVKLLTQQFLAIHGFQIETKHVFGFVAILTLLWGCKLGTSNLDSLIMIYKNWPIDVQTINHLWVENDVWIFL